MYILTLAEKGEAEVALKTSSGSDGQRELLKELGKTALAQSEFRANKKVWQKMDHVHLTRYNGTDFVQWVGRCSDGFHRPIGRVMQIFEVKNDPAVRSKEIS